MAKNKIGHTPGPWFVFGNGHCVAGPFEPGPESDPEQITAGVAMCGMRLRFNEEAEANARLIAAAPELLAACERVQSVMHRSVQPTLSEMVDAMLVLDAAVAKAKGV